MGIYMYTSYPHCHPNFFICPFKIGNKKTILRYEKMGNGEDYIMRDFLICCSHHRRDLGWGGSKEWQCPCNIFVVKSSFFKYAVERGANKKIG